MYFYNMLMDENTNLLFIIIIIIIERLKFNELWGENIYKRIYNHLRKSSYDCKKIPYVSILFYYILI